MTTSFSDSTIDELNQLVKHRQGAELIQAAFQEEAIDLGHHIFMSQGTSNAYLIVTKKHRVIINTGMGFEALTHKKVFDAVSDNPTSHIILTQAHVDHVGGVGQFKEDTTQVIAQARNPLCQLDDERIAPLRQSQSYTWFKDVIDKALMVAKDHPEVFIQDKPKVDVLFDDKVSYQIDERQIDVIAMHGGETLDSAIVWLPDDKICFSGNTFGPLFPHFPNFNTVRGDKYRFYHDYIKALDAIKALKPTVLITGHGMPIVGEKLIQAALTRLYEAVTYIHDTTLARMNKGDDVFSIMQTLTLPDHLNVGEGYGRVQWAIRTFWESYVGWFKLQSTTELLATPVSAVYSELIALAGVDALVARARLLFEGGELEQAMQLCNIAVNNGDSIAIELMIELHECLLVREGSNFWFKGWIEGELIRLRGLV